MAWLNYHHLLYFWTVARRGTIAQASKELHLSQPTISTQLKMLEDSFGHQLFTRQGRKLVLTDMGRTVYKYADDIFRMGRELQEAVARGGAGQPVRFVVGVSDVVPKLVAQRLLQLVFEALPSLQLVCHEGSLEQLMTRLALHELDLVLSDAPAPSDVQAKVFTHALGDSGTSFFARGVQAQELKRNFPAALGHTPLLSFASGSTARRQLDHWLESKGVRPKVVAEFDDSALMNSFGANSLGAFAAPTAIEDEVSAQYGVQVVGRAPDLRQAFFAISVERKLRHPGVVAIAESAKKVIFA
ncbi:MAG: transcriptional activator NhaR [Archangium sp.]|nr:transcriptional activator NhaR [Archangium sp.]